MTRYILIDSNSGYIFADQEADDPIEACRLFDESIGETGRRYAEDPHGTSGYYVYSVDPTVQLTITDIKDPDPVLQAGTLAAFVAVEDEDEE